MISPYSPSIPLTDEQITYAAMYYLRWNGDPSPCEENVEVAKDHIRYTLHHSVEARGIAGAFLKEKALP